MEFDNIVLMDCDERMGKSIVSFEESLGKLKTGRASASLVRDIDIDYWGSKTPLYQIANISTPEATQILIKPYDKNQLKEIEKAIILADLGFTPLNDGTCIRCNIPQLTGETRKDYVRQASSMAEEAKIALRNVRQDENNKIKKSEMTDDEKEMCLEIVQDLINKYNKIVEEKFKEKETELTSI